LTNVWTHCPIIWLIKNIIFQSLNLSLSLGGEKNRDQHFIRGPSELGHHFSPQPDDTRHIQSQKTCVINKLG